MSIFKGRSAHVGIALENESGTAANAAEYFIPRMDSSLKDTPEQIQNESSFGNIAHYNDQVTTGVHGEGDVQAKLWHKGLYYYLALIAGQKPTKEELEDGAFKYTFRVANNNNHLAATIFSQEPNRSCKYPSAMLNEASIEWSPSDFASLTMSFISKRSVDIDASMITPAYATDDAEFKPDQLEFKLAENAAALATADVAKLFRSVSMTITKNVEGEQTSDSGQDYGAMMNGDLEASISLEKLYTDQAYRNISLNDEARAISFGFVDTKNKAGTTNPTSLRFIFPKVMMSSYETSMGLSDTATESLEGIAALDIADGSLFTIELVTKYDYDQSESQNSDNGADDNTEPDDGE